MNSRGRYRYSDAEIKAIIMGAVVLTDTREQKNRHILTALDQLNVAHKPMALSFGDYSVMLPVRPDAGISRDTYFDGEIIIERKANLDELAGNFTTGRERFKDEMIRAGTARKYLIVEQGGGYAAILNGQYQSRLSSKSFFASLLSFQARYDLNVIFCGPDRTAEIIWGLLYYHVRTWLTG
ncbi:MAG: ERCC4 domain-containing protein [Oscillospiraceae bacterium]|jgi:ERCC4-type nuclease|nr:ERCC4 domain-containing protein [Oscillospiraceae bacterium]